MNRRTFIGTITALAGLALAKIKGNTASVPPKYVAGVDLALPGADHMAVYRYGIAGERLRAGDMVVFKQNKIYRYPAKYPVATHTPPTVLPR